MNASATTSITILRQSIWLKPVPYRKSRISDNNFPLTECYLFCKQMLINQLSSTDDIVSSELASKVVTAIAAESAFSLDLTASSATDVAILPKIRVESRRTNVIITVNRTNNPKAVTMLIPVTNNASFETDGSMIATSWYTCGAYGEEDCTPTIIA